MEVCCKMTDDILADQRAGGIDLLSFVAWIAEEALEGEADTQIPEESHSRAPKLVEHTAAVAYRVDYCLGDGNSLVAVDNDDP